MKMHSNIFNCGIDLEQKYVFEKNDIKYGYKDQRANISKNI